MRYPVLARVIYQLHEAPAVALLDPGKIEDSDLDREVRLEFVDGSALLASWLERDGRAALRGGGAAARTAVDVSGVDPWADLVGSSIDVGFADPGCQVLEISARQRSVYLYSPESGHWHLQLVQDRAGSRPLPMA